MKCPTCDFDNPDTGKFCAECGSHLSSLAATMTLKTAPVSPGKTVAGKYKIIAELGRGGMGVVYKAKDTRLKRTVALKFLPVELITEKEAKDRFIQEAQAAAALNHPNITVIHEVDEAEDQAFIAMEYIEGNSLKDKLKGGPLEIDEAKDIALQVAEGLKEAHEKGIVHRDIKPANIMLTKKGQAKITDFGLAKLSWGVDLTKTSTIMGTVAYMSPEQARGEEVDHRTDIWALGAMLYEMLSGERPFKKDREHALIYAILNDKPTPTSLLRSDVPTHIEQVIEKALAKKASERYQDIQELIQDLTLSIVFPKAEKSIVVLPFDDMSPNRDNEYFSDGLTEEIISDLSQIHDLLVISRSSAMTFKGTKKKINEIAEDVKVQYVLEGSVRKAGNSLRITAQLIEAANDVHLWAEKYSGTLDDVFDIQEKVSRSIVDALKLKLNPQEDKKISERPTGDLQAYECYLSARKEFYRGTEDGLKRALQSLQIGLEIIGDNALLNKGMAETYLCYYEYGVKADEETLLNAEEFAHKVIEEQPESADSYYLLGRIERFRGSVTEAVKYFKKAYDKNHDHTDNLMILCQSYGYHLGKPSLAEKMFERLFKIDPLNPINHYVWGLVQMAAGRLDDALTTFQKYSKLAGDDIFQKISNVYIFAWQKRYEEVFELVDQMVKQKSAGQIHDNITEWCLFFKYALQGEKTKAFETITEDVKSYFWNDPEFRWFGVCNYALIDEKEEALNWVEHMINRGWINYPFLNERVPFLENIRGEPRFKKLMERVKHEWENFEV